MKNRTSLVSLYKSKRRERPQPQSDHPPAIWQKIHKYPLPFHRTTEQLLSSGCETPELISNTPLPKIDVAGLKDTIDTLFMYKNDDTFSLYIV